MYFLVKLLGFLCGLLIGIYISIFLFFYICVSDPIVKEKDNEEKNLHIVGDVFAKCKEENEKKPIYKGKVFYLFFLIVSLGEWVGKN